IATSSGQPFVKVWREDFLWSGVSYMVAGSAGAFAAIVVSRGEHWKALLMLAPVHLTYRTYQLFVGRLADQRRHVAEVQVLHRQAIEALAQARAAERALATEKEREHAARANAEEANRLKDEFLAIVSHELRTPLNAILGWARLIRTGELDEETVQRALETIERNAQSQAQLIGDILDFSRIISGKLRLQMANVELPHVIEA